MGFPKKFMGYRKYGDMAGFRLVDNLRSLKAVEHFNSCILKMTIKVALSGSPFVMNEDGVVKHEGV